VGGAARSRALIPTAIRRARAFKKSDVNCHEEPYGDRELKAHAALRMTTSLFPRTTKRSPLLCFGNAPVVALFQILSEGLGENAPIGRGGARWCEHERKGPHHTAPNNLIKFLERARV
jgi:hypothetical protein